MIDVMSAFFVLCINQTVPNPFTVHNLTTEQCAVIYTYASEKCWSQIEPVCLGGECKEEDFDKIVELDEVCRSEE